MTAHLQPGRAIRPGPRPRGGSMLRRRRRTAIESAILLTLILIVVLAPVYWMIVTSLKSSADFYDMRLYVSHPTLTHYITLFETSNFGIQLFNSIGIAVCATLVTVVISVMAAYSLTRLRFRGRGTATAGVFFAYLLPPTLLLIPLYTMFADMGILNSWLSLILAYLTLTVPFCTWMLRGYLQNVPWELEEAAMVDGASRARAVRSVVLPLIAPGVAAGALFSFTLAWNEYLYAFVFTTKATSTTAPVGIASFVVGDVIMWGQIMAGAVVMSVPILVIYLAGQRWVVGGLTAGAVKG